MTKETKLRNKLKEAHDILINLDEGFDLKTIEKCFEISDYITSYLDLVVDIAKARKNIKEGKGITLEELKEKLKLKENE